jgi:hypothetical protein
MTTSPAELGMAATSMHAACPIVERVRERARTLGDTKCDGC